MRTLSQIIDQVKSGVADHDSIEHAVAAAFWAGQEQMRGQIVRGLEQRQATRRAGRYRHAERRAIAQVLSDDLLGGNGRDDSAELLAWQFAI